MRMETSEQNLARQAANGDSAAFAALLERSYDRLFRLAFRLTGSRHDAEDLTQDICAALPAKIASFRGDARFTTWLSRVAMNAAHDRRRRMATHAKAAEHWGDWEKNRQAELKETRDQTSWLIEAMNRLPETLRDTLALLLDEELTHAEAGEVLGVSEGTISWRLSEAKKHLREFAKEESGT